MNVAITPEVAEPEVGRTIDAAGIRTNVHDVGEGRPVLMIHGSGPGVSAWSNWRLNMPVLARAMRVVAPDCVGFGLTERPVGVEYDRLTWVRRLVLMGSSGLDFPLTPGLDAVWGYEPSVEAMRGLLDVFAYDRRLVTDDWPSCATAPPPARAWPRRSRRCSPRPANDGCGR